MTANAGWVSVGTDHDTADFAVETIRRWWRKMGRSLYPSATELLITADGGGSNSSRNRRWKVALQDLADELNLAIRVSHFPPGTSKWNKIEHCLFSQIGINWHGTPLTSHEVVVKLIANTTTDAGLRVDLLPIFWSMWYESLTARMGRRTHDATETSFIGTDYSQAA